MKLTITQNIEFNTQTNEIEFETIYEDFGAKRKYTFEKPKDALRAMYVSGFSIKQINYLEDFLSQLEQ